MIKIERTTGDSNLWKKASHYSPGCVLVQQDTGYLYLRIDSAIVRLSEENYNFEMIYISECDALFRSVKATLTVEV